MDRLTLGVVREPVARIMNVCSTDSDIPKRANEAERRLMAKGKWLNTTTRYRICTTAEGCLAWPRFIETIEAWWTCSTPGNLRNGWYEASLQGPGLLNGDASYWNTLVDRGTLPTYDTITGITSKVAVRADVAEAAGSRLLLRGYNQLGEWIRTLDGGIWIDGEYVTITNVATQYTTNLFASIVNVVKPVTNGPVRGWQFDVPTGTVVRQLFYYEPTETLPIYRASLIPGLANRSGSCGTGSCSTCGTTSTQVTVIAKLRHIDVIDDNDFFVLGNLAAIKLMVMSILKEERNLFDESVAYEARALGELQSELSSFEGDGAIPTIKSESSQSWGAGVLNPVTLGWPLTY